MQRTFLVGLFLLSLGNVACGQAVSIPNFVDSAWEKVQTFEGKYIVTKTFGSQPNENLVTSLNWMEDFQGKFLTQLTMSRFGQQSVNLSESYDGSTYTLLDKSGSACACKVSKTLPTDPKTFEFGLFPLEPFRFLTKSVAHDTRIHPSLHDIVACLNSDLPKLLVGPMHEATFGSKPSVYFELDGGHDVLFGKEIRYQVFLSKEMHQLLGWRCFSNGNRLNSELVIKDWKSVPSSEYHSVLHYPSAFTIQYFDDHGAVEGTVPSYGYSVATELTKISGKSDPASFTLDPAEADYIFDLDNKVTIKNPR